MNKPLGTKAYGHIPHLQNSRMGPGDHSCAPGQHTICCNRARDRHDEITVTEKLDGSCCAVAKVDGNCLALSRTGYLAVSSPYEQHHLFARWVALEYLRFYRLLQDGERVIGEWLAQAHGTRYALPHEPFVAFDIMRGQRRLLQDDAIPRLRDCGFIVPRLLHRGGPLDVADALPLIDTSGHGAIDPVEGAVWRVERNDPNPRGKGKHVDFLAKWVRPDKVDGKYLPEITGGEPVWNTYPAHVEVA